MFVDQDLVLATAFNIAGSTTNAPTAISSVVDLSVLRDVGPGKAAYLRIACVEAPVASTPVGSLDGVAFTVVVATNVFTAVANGFSVGTPVVASDLVDVTGLAVDGTIYYVVPINADTFKLASTLALALAYAPDVDATGADGSGYLTVGASPVNEFSLMLVTASTADLQTDAIVLCQGPPWGSSLHAGGFMPAVGDVFNLPIPDNVAATPGRYLGVMFRNAPLGYVTQAPAFASASFTAGQFHLSIVIEHPQQHHYPVGYTA